MQNKHNVTFSFQRAFLLSVLLIGFSINSMAQTSKQYDIVINGGQVIDPETKLNAIRNIGITDNRIVEISTEALNGIEVIDAAGLVVSPGFIDLHVHGTTNKEQAYQVHDGVTSAFELESGIPFLKDYFKLRESNALINYGASVNLGMSRIHAVHETEFDQLKEARSKGERLDKETLSTIGRTAYETLQVSQYKTMLDHVKNSLNEGGIGIGISVGYWPGSSREEIFRVYELAGELDVPIFTHVREGGTIAIQQAISDAVVTGASLHVVHVNSMALAEIALAIEMVNKAQERGFDITTELYPYTAASTGLASAIFDAGWKERLGIDYGDIQWVQTGERLTQTTFDKYRKTGGTVIIHMMKPEWIKAGLSTKGTIVASDGMPYAKLAHPRTAGTFSRVLGKYVREENVLSLEEAIEKMTLLPAKRLEKVAPIMRYKGRIQVGADADITVFDPNTIIDKATFEEGLAFSEGVKFVMVNGTLIIKKGEIVENTFPGLPVYGKYKK
jgi:Amidohydrolase family